MRRRFRDDFWDETSIWQPCARLTSRTVCQIRSFSGTISLIRLCGRFGTQDEGVGCSWTTASSCGQELAVVPAGYGTEPLPTAVSQVRPELTPGLVFAAYGVLVPDRLEGRRRHADAILDGTAMRPIRRRRDAPTSVDAPSSHRPATFSNGCGSVKRRYSPSWTTSRSPSITIRPSATSACSRCSKKCRAASDQPGARMPSPASGAIFPPSGSKA